MGVALAEHLSPRLQKNSRALQYIPALLSGFQDPIDAISNITDTIEDRVCDGESAMTKRKKKDEQSPPLPPELETRKLEAEVHLLELKIESTRLQNLSKQLDLDERSNALCYCTQAVKEFSRGVQAIMTAIKGLPDVLQERCSLTPDQYKEVAEAVYEIRERLSHVEFNLESSAELQARASALTAKNSASAEQRESKIASTKAKAKAKGRK